MSTALFYKVEYKKLFILSNRFFLFLIFLSSIQLAHAVNHSIVIDDFELFQVGDSWPKVRDTEIIDHCDLGDKNNQCLRIKFMPTARGSDRLTKKVPIPARDHYLLSYDIYFEPGFEFRKGGKLPGLSPSYATTGCAEVAPNSWSARLMWRSVGTLSNYYYGQNKSGACGDGEASGASVFNIGQWHHVELNVKLNSEGGGYNGHVISKVDNQIVADDIALQLRSNFSESSLINTFLFSTFFGGDDSSWAPSKVVYARFDNFVVTPLGASNFSAEGENAQQPKRPEPPRLFVLSSLGEQFKKIGQEGFEDARLGAYLDGEWKENFDAVDWVTGFSSNRGSIVNTRSISAQGQSLQILFPKDVTSRNDSGIRWVIDVGGNYRSLSLSYWIYFDEDFDFGNGGKLPGLAHSGNVQEDQWTVILSWVNSGFLRTDVSSSAEYRQHKMAYEDRFPRLSKGEWQFLEMYVVVNDKNQSNGSVEVWLNHEKVSYLNRQNFAPEGVSGPVNRARLSTYMESNGGSILNSKDQYAWFDDMVLSRIPI